MRKEKMINNYTEDQLKALERFKNGDNVFLTGRPGTGKTELLRDICQISKSKGRRVLITGSTGMAASNLGSGRTIHSALKWNPCGKKYDYDYCSQEIRKVDLLVIDEVSMLNTSIINHLANCLRSINEKPQIILSGDFCQLPPVKDTRFPFENLNWPFFNLAPCILNQVVRQNDPEYVQMLDKARWSDPSCISYFNRALSNPKADGAITLCTKNDYADRINREYFERLPGDTKIYEASGDVEEADFSKTRIKNDLWIKKDMRVMTLRNDPEGYYKNGSLGTVVDLRDDMIVIRLDQNNKTVGITRVDYSLDSTDPEVGSAQIKQFPLVGAYAISIHKSQGQTFDSFNLFAPKCWEFGQLYVALSRGRDINKIHFDVPINADSLKVNPRVVEFYNTISNCRGA